jgi:PadR family transcriptional regulator, regulatory protein PadR
MSAQPAWHQIESAPSLPLDSLKEQIYASHLDYQEEKVLVADQNLEPDTTSSGDLVQGTLEMLVLKTLALEPMHGYGVALRIEQISRGVFRVNPGSLLPALSRMERAGSIRSEWHATENNRRAKYYTLTAKGRRTLAAETERWANQAAAIARILEAKAGA